MTENKRFTSDIHRIYCDNEEIACADTMGDAETIVDRLNEQYNLIKELESENKMLKTTKRWSFNGGVIVGTDICEEGIPHTNRSIVTHLNMYERKIRELEEENEQLKSDNKEYIKGLDLAKATSQSWASDVRELREENCRLEKEKEELKDGLQEFRGYCNYLKSILEDNEIWYE